MKKIVLTVFLLSIVTLGFSQGYGPTKYGIRAGINISNLDFEPEPITQNLHRNGFYFGGFFEFPVSEILALNTEINWSAEGAKEESFQADYLNLPIQLKFAVSESFSFGLGPQASLKTWKDNDAFETFTFSGVGTIEYNLWDDYFIDVRAVYGITDMLNSDVVGNLEAKQFLIQVGIGIKI